MRARICLLSLALLALTSCDPPAPALSAEAPPSASPTPAAAPPAQPAPASSAPPQTSAGTDPRLPVLGDPLGLLSKAPAGGSVQPSARSRTGALDPAALMGSAPGAQPATNGLERDPRAVERARTELAPRPAPASAASVPLQDRSARDVVRRASQGGARVHVLLLYASYCKACRGVMPWFVKLARSYKARGVAFTAASVDADRDAFAAYAPVLEGALEPIWILPDTGTKAELKRAGLKLSEEGGYSIPLFAVFAGQNRLVAQGNSRELRELSATLDGLL